MFTITKTWRDLPAAHRQHNHEGHCRLIHGHNWSFDVVFTCDILDGNGFVIDVGKLEVVRDWLKGKFDHTLLLNQDDPFRPRLQVAMDPPDLEEGKIFAQIVTVPNCGMEGLARWVFEEVTDIIRLDVRLGGRGLRVVGVTCWEDSKNRASYAPDE